VSTTRRLAMLIDGDNAQASLINEILAEANKYGVITIRRIYGDWTEPQMNSWKSSLNNNAVQPIQQFRYTVGKNATDSALIIDAMDILYTAGVDGFCLVSSDSDYTRLATRIREKSLFVMGIGKQNTPRPFVNACDVFVYTENLQAEIEPVVTVPTVVINEVIDKAVAQLKPPKLRNGDDTSTVPVVKKQATLSPLHQLFRKAFEAAVNDDGWATLSGLGDKLRQLDPAFDPRTYGHKSLQPLVQAHPDVFEISKNSKGGMIVRLKDESVQKTAPVKKTPPATPPVKKAAAPAQPAAKKTSPKK